MCSLLLHFDAWSNGAGERSGKLLFYTHLYGPTTSVFNMRTFVVCVKKCTFCIFHNFPHNPLKGYI